jgi:hypothetical protein
MKTILIAISLLLSDILIAQSTNDSIIMNHSGFKGMYHFKQVNQSEIRQIIIQNPNAYKKVKLRNGLMVPAYILCGAGGGFLGVSLGQLITRQTVTVDYLASGLASSGVGLLINHIADYQFYKAIDIYNAGLSNKITSSRLNLQIVGNQNGIGLVLNFKNLHLS